MSEPTLAELIAEAHHAAQRVALQRQKLYSGRGDPRRLAELERVADGATERLRRREEADAAARR
jgi:hypothetical protein